MTLACPTQAAAALDHPSDCFVLFDAGSGRGLTLLPRRRRDALLARLARRWLDARLAAGEAPDGSLLLAVRAAQLVRVRGRARLARRWDALAVEARRRAARSRAEVAEHLQRVADVLRGDGLVFAHGVAIAITMRAPAAKAVQRLHTGGDDLVAAIARDALAAMTPPLKADQPPLLPR